MTKILIIEDDEKIRCLVSDILEFEGFDVIEAEDGYQGINLSISELPDLIVCDIRMPGLDGYGVLSQLQQDPKTATIPFIFLTAKGTKADLRQGMNLGADDYVTKPFTQDELLNVIKTRLKKRTAIEARYYQEIKELRSSISLSFPHELQSPLTAILGGTSLLIENFEDLQDRDTQEILKCILTSGKNLYELIQRFLLYINLEMLTEQSQKESRASGIDLDLDIVLIAIADASKKQAEQAKRQEDLELELMEPCDPTFRLRIDETNLRQLLIESIDNAFKFSKSGTLVKITSRIEDNNFIITVSDRGRGMVIEQPSKIGAYMQFDRSKYEQQGIGLGLAIVQKIVYIYNGILTIESIPKRGTNLYFKFPLRTESTDIYD